MYLDHITNDELADVAEGFEKAITLCLEISRVLQNYKKTGDNGYELLRVIKEYREKTPFIFKGDLTDLSYFWQHGAMAMTEIQALPEEIRSNVEKNLTVMYQEGLVVFNSETQAFMLTEKGRETIFTTQYVSEVMKSDMDTYYRIENGLESEISQRQHNAPAGGSPGPAPFAAGAIGPLAAPEKLAAAIRDRLMQIDVLAETSPAAALQALKELGNNCEAAIKKLEAQGATVPPEVVELSKAIDKTIHNVVIDGEDISVRVKAVRGTADIEINFEDQTLSTVNEIRYEAAKTATRTAKEDVGKTVGQGRKELVKETAKETAGTAARAAGTAGVAFAAEVGYKVLTGAVKAVEERVRS